MLRLTIPPLCLHNFSDLLVVTSTLIAFLLRRALLCKGCHCWAVVLRDTLMPAPMNATCAPHVVRSCSSAVFK